MRGFDRYFFWLFPCHLDLTARSCVFGKCGYGWSLVAVNAVSLNLNLCCYFCYVIVWCSLYLEELLKQTSLPNRGELELGTSLICKRWMVL